MDIYEAFWQSWISPSQQVWLAYFNKFFVGLFNFQSLKQRKVQTPRLRREPTKFGNRVLLAADGEDSF